VVTTLLLVPGRRAQPARRPHRPAQTAPPPNTPTCAHVTDRASGAGARHASQNESLPNSRSATGWWWERRGAVRGANGEQIGAPNGPELHSTVLNGSALTCGSRVSAGQCTMPSLVHTEEVAGSIPASPTACFPSSDGLSMIFIGGPSVILGSKWGARPADHKPQSEEVMPLLAPQRGFPARPTRHPAPTAAGGPGASPRSSAR
jgi:hypothetical protein